jgi:hypothetical protein
MAALLNPTFPQEPGPAVPQPADPGQLAGNPPLWIAAPTGAQNNGLGGPVIEVRIADIFRFPADAIIVPTDADMQRSRYGPFPHKWHRYAGRNLGAYNEHVHRPGGISAIAGLPSTTSAVKSLSTCFPCRALNKSSKVEKVWGVSTDSNQAC